MKEIEVSSVSRKQQEELDAYRIVLLLMSYFDAYRINNFQNEESECLQNFFVPEILEILY